MANQITCDKCHSGDMDFVRRSVVIRGRTRYWSEWVFTSADPSDLHNTSMGTFWDCNGCH